MIKGVVRLFDKLGRVTIPMEMRRTLKLNDGDPVDIHIKSGVICIKPLKLKCVCCGNEDEKNLIGKNEVLLCKDCISDFFSKTY